MMKRRCPFDLRASAFVIPSSLVIPSFVIVRIGSPFIRELIMDTLLDRFLRYVRIDTQADERAETYPSSPGQLVLGRLLAKELRDLGLHDAAQDEHGIVLATIPSTTGRDVPTIAWIAHVDTSPETTA